ncbi:hypothetical protein CMV_026150, partial [Castanea mollissima]
FTDLLTQLIGAVFHEELCEPISDSKLPLLKIWFDKRSYLI